MRAHAIASTVCRASGLAVVLSGCMGTHLTVHARTPNAISRGGILVRLVQDGRGACEDGSLFWGRTEENGTVRALFEVCGDMNLILSGRDIQTYQHRLNTCDTASVIAQLRAAQPAAEPDDSCARIASDFLHAWWQKKPKLARALLADSSPVVDVSRGQAWVEPWAIRVRAVRVEAAVCTANAELLFETGCNPTWRVDLHKESGEWRVFDYLPLSSEWSGDSASATAASMRCTTCGSGVLRALLTAARISDTASRARFAPRAAKSRSSAAACTEVTP
jgi:hypothetical protein